MKKHKIMNKKKKKKKSNTYDRTFLRKQLTAKNRGLFLQKGSVIDARLGSK